MPLLTDKCMCTCTSPPHSPCTGCAVAFYAFLTCPYSLEAQLRVTYWRTRSFSPTAAHWPWSNSPGHRGSSFSTRYLPQELWLLVPHLTLFLAFGEQETQALSQIKWDIQEQKWLKEEGEKRTIRKWVFSSFASFGMGSCSFMYTPLVGG